MANEENDLQVAPADSGRSVGEEILNNQINAERERYQPTGLEKFFAILKSLLIRVMIIYFISQFFRRPQPQNTTGASSNPGGSTHVPASNLYQTGTLFDVFVYLSEEKEFGDFNNSDSLIWQLKSLDYGSYSGGENDDGIYTFSTTFPTSESLRSNGSIYLHSFMVFSGKSPNPNAGKGVFSRKSTIHKMFQLNKFKKKIYKKTANLLTGETEATLEEQRKANEGIKHEIISHWHSNLTINVVNDFTAWTPGNVPPPLDEFVEFTPSLQNYKPIMYLNDYWNLNKDFTIINETVTSLNLTITFQPISLFKWQIYCAQQMKSRYNIMANFMGDENDEDMDSMKEAILETNIYILGLTFAVSILHSIFEFFAFKNDIQFWKNRKTLEGLSVRSVFFNVFQSLIVVLYVFDNDTNPMIKLSCFVGFFIELWKINKVIDIQFDKTRKLFGIIPYLIFKDKGSYEDSGTKEIDRLAFKYLGILLFPFVIGFMIYSAVYNEHKGWYSFILGSTYGFLLTFGFIMMTPQLFINYKLKSVAHLPWRMMTYKALNTFIDDIFAFVIKMPTAYRLGCFRDDIVFFIFLYQRYIYRVDKSRVNEFGFSGDMEETPKEASGDETPAAIKSEKSEETKKND
uniref:Cleft lip and palate transmembrane protein 1 homolog [Ceratitis capitata] n=1 Tax=Lepeophtheirus salmonis TaxID=72036 RepID=A0A0K2TD77_LEPSM